MRERWMLAALPGLLWGCASEGDLGSSVSELDDLAILVEDSGHWEEYDCSYTCWRKQFFWVDLDVRDDAYDKEVAIVWTKNAWESQEVAYATYEGESGPGRERWGVDVFVGAFSGPIRDIEVEYAAFVKMAGATHWDPYNNHYIYGRVTEEDPVTLLDSEVGYEENAGGVLSGTVRVFNLAYEKQVTVVYTVDDWATSAEGEASWFRGEDWRFRIEGLGGDRLPDYVRFAIRYRSAGQEYWDNNFGGDYLYRMEPSLSAYGPYAEPGERLSGILTANANAWSDIPIEHIDARVDDEAWRIGGSGQTWRQIEFSSLDVGDGKHTVEFRAVLDGGYQTTATSELEVKNRIVPLGAWDPDFGDLEPEGETGWSDGFAVDDSGRLYVQWDEPWSNEGMPFRGVARFASFGTDAAPVLYEQLPVEDSYASVTTLAADEVGRVYGLQSYPWTVWRWNSDGEIDTTFANDGKLDLGMEFEGHYLDNIGDIAAGGGYLWIIGTCPPWVDECDDVAVRFDEQGAFDAMVDLPEPASPYYYRDVGAATFSDGALWVIGGDKLSRIGEDAEGELALLESTDLPGSPQFFATDVVRTDDGRFFALSWGELAVLDAEGAIVTRWQMYSNTGLEGGVSSALQLGALGDGNIGVLDSEGARIVVFDDVLLP